MDSRGCYVHLIYRDGDDGPWSSFTLRLGTPEQNVRVFVSSSSPDTWVVLPNACSTGDSNCLEERGQTYDYNTSSTWRQHGFFQISTEQNLNLSAQAVFGNETLGLGVQGSGGPTLTDQIVAGYTGNDFYLGMFGLNPASTNFTPQDQGQASYMSTLKSQNLIPSISFGYTAGNKYRLKQVLGSLTLGGVDTSRFTPSNLTIPFAPDPARNLMVGIQAITSADQNGAKSDLLPDAITSFVDTTVPQIWLPTAACQAFEKAFGLTFDDTSDLYLVNDSLHNHLLNQNASVTFTLGSTPTGEQTTDIVLPYKSFDLLVAPPTPNVANSSMYFPLRRAANDSQYTLGRTLFQEAWVNVSIIIDHALMNSSYLTVDWERQNFSISQCVFQENAPSTLVAIKSSNSTSSSGSGGSSTGKTAGIAVGVVLGVLIIVGAICALFFLKRKRDGKKGGRKLDDSPSPDEIIRQGFDKGELGTGADNERYEVEGSGPNQPKQEEPAEWVDEKARHPGHGASMAEADAGGVSVPELGSSRQGVPMRPLHEMYDPSALAIELPGDHPSTGELQGSNPNSPMPSPGIFARSRGSVTGSPVSHSSLTKRRSLRDRLIGRPQASRTSTVDSLPSLTSSAGAAPSPAPHDDILAGAGHSSEPFSPVSRQGTFTPDSMSRAGTFTPDPVSRQGTASPRGTNPILSPVSPTTPEVSRSGRFAKFRGPSK